MRSNFISVCALVAFCVAGLDGIDAVVEFFGE